MPPSYHRKPKPSREYQNKKRNCLKCGEKFLSEWTGERICPKCKQTTEWRSGAGISAA
ncbi:MAG: hypothetical protein CFH39_01579 [Alphaproteobacteria bacterium MarineAlpha10_Bin2]|jgi:Zn finger protein HypA/HybF involved in hydrogenase expression|nr:MAG: hypothetical protein CFH39_01579 [Alphaproteobacteria bacterium MarineAlpha10_Bin2]